MRYSAELKIGRRSFSIVLPVAELAIWAMLVVAPVLVTIVQLAWTAHGPGRVQLRLGSAEEVVQRSRWLSLALERVSFERWQTVTAMNLPGTVVEILISVPAGGVRDSV